LPIPSKYFLFTKLEGESISGKIAPNARSAAKIIEKLREKSLIARI